MKIRLACLTLALTAGALSSACAPLMLGGAAVSGVMLYNDRRTSGAQVEDQSIEVKASQRLNTLLGSRGHVSVTSYNRILLVTGEVATEEDRVALEQVLAAIENVRSVVNECAVTTASSLTARSNDLILTSKVKATFLDAGDLEANAFKVITERGIVYLMGRVTSREADRATTLARNVSGVQKVVRVVETISESDLRELKPRPRSAAGS
jgi:osmotically-inducible protein OsmY